MLPRSPAVATASTPHQPWPCCGGSAVFSLWEICGSEAKPAVRHVLRRRETLLGCCVRNLSDNLSWAHDWDDISSYHSRRPYPRRQAHIRPRSKRSCSTTARCAITRHGEGKNGEPRRGKCCCTRTGLRGHDLFRHMRCCE